MSILHLCNTFFEWELAGQFRSLEEASQSNPIVQQLQFLPLLYADPSDGILVSGICPGSPSGFSKLETWGHSRLAKAWADEKKIPYDIPDWDLVKMVNSKAYSFSKSPLPGGKLLRPGEAIPSDTILKTCFGTAGRGHLQSNSTKAKTFCEKQWDLGLPVISEPWVNREIDFSTQWKIEQNKEIVFLGTTQCITTSSGSHRSNIVGDAAWEQQYAPFIEAQKNKAQEVLEEMAGWGFFGEVGFDAMIYGDRKLQPVVEINARKTMGWATLMLQQKHYPGKRVEMAYVTSKEPGPLPTHLGQMNFSRQIIISSG